MREVNWNDTMVAFSNNVMIFFIPLKILTLIAGVSASFISDIAFYNCRNFNWSETMFKKKNQKFRFNI